jgi:hypothetical protein
MESEGSLTGSQGPIDLYHKLHYHIYNVSKNHPMFII